jgi:hypothetical protein
MPAQYPSDAVDAFKKAIDLHNANKLVEAIAQYDKTISLHKGFLEG